MIKAVFFDLDGTLYDRDAVVRKLVGRSIRGFLEELRDVSASVFIERIVDLDDHGYGSKPELYNAIATEWDLPSELATRLLEYFWSNYDSYCQVPEDTLNTLHTLRRCGEKLGIITNGAIKVQQKEVQCLGIGSLFDAVLISEAEGLRKPDPLIFQRALEQCKVRASEAAFVGDHPDVDIAGRFGTILTVDQIDGELRWHVSVSALADGFKPIFWEKLKPSLREGVRQLARELLEDIGQPGSDFEVTEDKSYQIIRKLTIEEERLIRKPK